MRNQRTRPFDFLYDPRLALVLSVTGMTVTPLILVVDDDPAIRESMERELRASGYATASASDGAVGVRAFETRAPDLVLTDLSMPRSDGFELISAIRATARTPILVLSVRGNDADK